MHELGIMANVLDIVLEYSQKNNVSKVHKISLEIGEYSGIVPKLAQDFFGYISKGTIAEGADVVIEKVPLRAKCRDCGEEMSASPEQLQKGCPACGSKNVGLLSLSRGWRLDTLEVE